MGLKPTGDPIARAARPSVSGDDEETLFLNNSKESRHRGILSSEAFCRYQDGGGEHMPRPAGRREFNMDNIKTSSKKMRGGILASAIVLLFTLLTLGIGTAFGAEGGLVGLLKKAVGDVASPVMNAASGGMLRAEGGDDKLQVPIRIVWDDNDNEYGVRPSSVTLSLRACLDGSQWGGADIPSATITPTGDSWETTIEVDKTYVNTYSNQEYSVTGVEYQ
jgi:hypothetical protein